MQARKQRQNMSKKYAKTISVSFKRVNFPKRRYDRSLITNSIVCYSISFDYTGKSISPKSSTNFHLMMLKKVCICVYKEVVSTFSIYFPFYSMVATINFILYKQNNYTSHLLILLKKCCYFKFNTISEIFEN